MGTAFLVALLVRQTLNVPRCAIRRHSNPEGKRWDLHFPLELVTAPHGHTAERCYNANADEKECG